MSFCLSQFANKLLPNKLFVMVDRFISKPPKPPLVSWANNASDLTKKRALGQLNDYGNNNREMEILAVNYDKLNLCNDIPHEHVELQGSVSINQNRPQYFYVVTVSKDGVHCNCRHANMGNTCKHCLFVLHNHVGVKTTSLMDTQECQFSLRQHIMNGLGDDVFCMMM